LNIKYIIIFLILQGLLFFGINKIDNIHKAELINHISQDIVKEYKETNNNFDNIVYSMLLSLIILVFYINERQKRYLEEKIHEKTKELKKLNSALHNSIKEEVHKNTKQEEELIKSLQKAQMAEMIGNVAHQWRQPLSLISTLSSSVLLYKEMGDLKDEYLIKSMNQIENSTKYLSETLDTFKNFIKNDKVLKLQSAESNICDAIAILNTVLKNNNIYLKENFDKTLNTNINIVSGELPQVIINIINNSIDALVENEIENKQIEISLIKNDNYVLITIEDNAQGIPDEYIKSIFDPYFTTKSDTQGTGLGLYMSCRIIKESIKGDIYVKNTNKGAKFYIEIPIEQS